MVTCWWAAFGWHVVFIVIVGWYDAIGDDNDLSMIYCDEIGLREWPGASVSSVYKRGCMNFDSNWYDSLTQENIEYTNLQINQDV